MNFSFQCSVGIRQILERAIEIQIIAIEDMQLFFFVDTVLNS